MAGLSSGIYFDKAVVPVKTSPQSTRTNRSESYPSQDPTLDEAMTFFINVWNILRNFKVTSLTLEGESFRRKESLQFLKNHAPKKRRGGETGHHEN